MNEVQFSPDGRTIVFRQGTAPFSINYRALTGDTTTRPLVTSPYEKFHPAISPNGHWMAYTSYETGSPRVYVRAFPGPASKWAVSDGTGSEPSWSADGHTIYYRAPGKMVAAHVVTSPMFAIQSRQVLFGDDFIRANNHRGYDVSPDGRKFVMIASGDINKTVTVAWNWANELRGRLKTK